MTSRVVILGGGHAGSVVARGLHPAVRRGDVELHLVDAGGVRVRHERLGNVAAGAVSAHTSVDDLERLLTHVRHHRGHVVAVDEASRTVSMDALRWGDTSAGEGSTEPAEPVEIPWDHLVVTLGATTEDLGVPGVRAHALGFRKPADALRLGARLRARAAACSVVVVGGGHAGVTAAGCAVDLLRAVTASIHGQDGPGQDRTGLRGAVRVVLVDRKPRLFTAHDPRLGSVVSDDLRAAGVDLVLGVPVTEVTARGVALRDGTFLEADTVVWTAGVRAPTVIESAFPGEKSTGGRLVTDPMLAVHTAEDVWACGDVASVPDLERGGDCPQSAHHAGGQAKRLARNLLAVLEGGWPAAYRSPGNTIVVPTGVGRAAGIVNGRPVRGPTATLTAAVTAATAGRLAADVRRSLRSGPASRPPIATDPHVPLETPRPKPAVTSVSLGARRAD